MEPLGAFERAVATGSASRSSPWTKAAHICIGGGGWLLLGLLWLWQAETRDIPRDWLIVVAATVGSGFALAVLSTAWVRWNQNIYRRRHNRHKPLLAEVQFELDAVGRQIIAESDERKGSQIVISVDRAAAVKHYLTL